MITKTQIRQTVQWIADNHGIDIAVHWAYGRPRCTTKDEARDISPRLPAGQLKLWLDGFEAGLSAARDANASQLDQWSKLHELPETKRAV